MYEAEQAISQALQEAARQQPPNPVAFIGDWLKARSMEAHPAEAGQWSRPPGIIHKATFSVRDPEESAAFCERYLHAVRIPVPDASLEARGIRWVRLAGGAPGVPAAEFHFVPWDQDCDTGRRGGIDLNGDGIVDESEMVELDQRFIASLIDAADQDMAVWSVYANTHIAWCVDELTSVVTRLQQDGVKFFGPTRRADGVFQLYVELPYLHYIEIDSLVYDEKATGRAARGWDRVTSRGGAPEAPRYATEDARGRPLAPFERLRHPLSSPPAAESAAGALDAEAAQHGRALAPVERLRHAWAPPGDVGNLAGRDEAVPTASNR